MQKRRDAKIRQDMYDREASLARAKTQAALAEGISWGMSEDAPEELGEVSVCFQQHLDSNVNNPTSLGRLVLPLMKLSEVFLHETIFYQISVAIDCDTLFVLKMLSYPRMKQMRSRGKPTQVSLLTDSKKHEAK